MDIDKLIEQLRWWADNCDRTNYGCQARPFLLDAATALSTLKGENEKMRAELEYEKEHANAYYEECGQWEAENAQLKAKLEAFRRERDDLIEDFVDYVTGGVPNPAIFCKNRCDKCTDMRGWCTGKDCKGFYPSGASGRKED